MVLPLAAGVLFTADPMTGNRKVVSVEAAFGLGEVLVSGLVEPDHFEVRDGVVVRRSIAAKRVAIEPRPGGGTVEVALDAARQAEPTLTDDQVIQLAELGRRIEAHLGTPQDIEWCLTADGFRFVQSRPITTVFPIPETDDGANHVYLSVGHQQMMTDPMKPLGLSLWQLITPRPMAEAGGRLFVDVTEALASPPTRAGLLAGMGRSDPLMSDALQVVLDRGDFVPALLGDAPAAPVPRRPARLRNRSRPIRRSSPSSSSTARRRSLRWSATSPLCPARRCSTSSSEDLQELRRILMDPRSFQVFTSAMEAAWWLNEQLEAWLGETSAADTLAQSVPDNVTAQMGLALLDVADVIRPHPEVVSFLEGVEDEGVPDELADLPGGLAARNAIRAFLDTYGMRCAGEIDITRPRWSERPATLVPAILDNVRLFEPGEATRRFEQGREEARAKEVEVLERLRSLPDGDEKADEVKRRIDRVRTFMGYREYPKYGMVSRYFVYKRALLAEAERLVQAGVLHDREDIYFLRFEELHEVVRTRRVDDELIRRRTVEFETYRALSPPRVLTSDGEGVVGTYRRDGMPPGALVGLPVSGGTVEGRARVLHDIAEADLDEGDILVTPYTDPSWTPLFVAIAGLVTEVGGTMTHGAVIAREYGLPAVVGVQGATRLIRDGQRIRVDGTEGYVEILDRGMLG